MVGVDLDFSVLADRVRVTVDSNVLRRVRRDARMSNG
jgi:hypothetical protein